MGTKNEPGKFDCYSNAEPDEPMFVLLARDPLAPILVRLWADLKLAASNEPQVSNEAMQCADTMGDWLAKNRPGKRLEITRPKA